MVVLLGDRHSVRRVVAAEDSRNLGLRVKQEAVQQIAITWH
jgi:hypothetical protein